MANEDKIKILEQALARIEMTELEVHVLVMQIYEGALKP